MNEVNVVVGDLGIPETYLALCQKCDAIIHCASDYSNYDFIDSTAVNTFIKSASGVYPKKIVIYTSGILVLPNDPSRIMDETEPTHAQGILKNRPSYEQQILTSKELIGVVVRPAYVFGKKSTHFVNYFGQAQKGRVVVKGNPDIIWSQVHIDDLVDGYIRILHSSPGIIDGQVFHFSDSSRYNNLQIATVFSKAAGFTGIVEVDEKGGLEYSQKTVMVDSRKANHLLGWFPQHLLLLDEVDLYYRSWMQRQKN